MAFSTSVQYVEKPTAPVSKTPNNDLGDVLFSMVLLSVYGAQMSKKSLRKLKRQFFWTSLKLKVTSLFKSKRDLTQKELLYIIAGAIFIALLFINLTAALILALLVIVLILAGVI